MKTDRLITILAFHQEYYIAATHHSNVATVYLIIDHTSKNFNIRPKMPPIGDITYDLNRSSHYMAMDDVAILYRDISTDFNRAIALQACVFRATLYAIETLTLAKPTEIEAAKRLFIDDFRINVVC